jgi:hypothetical protein
VESFVFTPNDREIVRMVEERKEKGERERDRAFVCVCVCERERERQTEKGVEKGNYLQMR